MFEGLKIDLIFEYIFSILQVISNIFMFKIANFAKLKYQNLFTSSLIPIERFEEEWLEPWHFLSDENLKY